MREVQGPGKVGRTVGFADVIIINSALIVCIAIVVLKCLGVV
jgi:hypothetical protein